MPTNLIQQAREALTARMAQVIAEATGQEADPSQFKIEQPPEPAMGHLAFACFTLAKTLRKAPPAIAADLAPRFGEHKLFSKVEALGPYVNFFLQPQLLAKEVLSQCHSGNLGRGSMGEGKRILLEYSSPNTNKPLHLGHGRNNLLGITLSRLLEEQGFEVIKANLINDRGIHICKSMLAYQKWGEGVTPESTGKKGDKLVGDFYVLYDKKFKEDPDLEDEARRMLKDWEEGKPETMALWDLMNQWVYAGFKETYSRMGVSFDQFYYESQTYQGGRELILKALEEGIARPRTTGLFPLIWKRKSWGKRSSCEATAPACT